MKIPKPDARKPGSFTRSSNIAACAALASLVAPMLGPCGRRNIVIEQCEALTVTNDGATLLSHLRYTTSATIAQLLGCSVEHPVASSLVSLSRSMDRCAHQLSP